MFDLLIRSADIIDGTGRPAFRSDLAVKSGRIAEIGPIPPNAQAREVIDSRLTTHDSRLALCPGFIDIHTHADVALLARPDHLPKVMQGVTTEVFSNCGLGFAPVTPEGLEIQREYLLGLFGDDAGVDWGWRSVAGLLERYERQGTAANVAYLIPHGAVRVSVMGMAARPADVGEIAAMERMVREGREQGAWGLSTGLWYAPMCHAGRAENVALCHAAGFFATHQRDYADDIFAATEESLAIAREAGVPVQIAHLQMNGPGTEGRAPELLALLEQARAGGVDVTCDTYPYTAGSTMIQALLPAWAADGGPEAILRRLADPPSRKRMVAALEAGEWDWDRFTLVGAASAENGPLEGRTFAEAAAARGLPVPEWICAVLEEDGLRACYVAHFAHEGNVRVILRWPGQMVGSDGLHLRGKCHPRLYGTFPRILGRYVREEKVLPLEEAVRKMTSAPAARLGLKERGALAVGMAADLVLFDPEIVRDSATFEDPLCYPEGIPYVFVNGVAVKRDNQPTGALPGKVLRRA
jgi:N-acyl-D-amino-acid deacylase